MTLEARTQWILGTSIAVLGVAVPVWLHYQSKCEIIETEIAHTELQKSNSRETVLAYRQRINQHNARIDELSYEIHSALEMKDRVISYLRDKDYRDNLYDFMGRLDRAKEAFLSGKPIGVSMQSAGLDLDSSYPKVFYYSHLYSHSRNEPLGSFIHGRNGKNSAEIALSNVRSSARESHRRMDEQVSDFQNFYLDKTGSPINTVDESFLQSLEQEILYAKAAKDSEISLRNGLDIELEKEIQNTRVFEFSKSKVIPSYCAVVS